MLVSAVVERIAAVRASVAFDGLQQVGSTPIMQEEESLANTPQGSRAELIRPRRALTDTVRQVPPHMVEREIGVGLVSHSAHSGEARVRCGQRG